ncbi:HNH endonuclease signature motif containing protein [uncultured Muribaculum sp.]|uniref:HNH endonuclease signature motif containing protein n=2 Tax=uncultured Muribaculum sp. TaxID=1918613 RepID=UPI0026DFBEA7|nr:HNH endonuclease signature motif containing protein [uncultured Muribaculum sp.]
MYYILNDYTETKECSYKGELYSVRDNGAILRHSREGKRIRKDDNTWTFGKPNENTGYMEIGSERVHRIVAFAFLGEPPTSQHIVDHIDTNRRNNRPQNLRWLTKLENALNNPITRKKIEYLCGSIEAFVNDPSIIQEFVNDNPNYEWMKTVTQEEAKASYERLCAWAETKSDKKSLSGRIGEWIYTPYKNGNKNFYFEMEQHRIHATSKQTNNMIGIDLHTDNLTESLTLNAVQKYWRTPTEFPLCPSKIGDNPLNTYLNNLKKGAIVTKNQNSTHFINDFALCNDNRLVISTHTNDGAKKFSMITITFEGGKFVHKGTTFFEERGAQKALTLAQGLIWDGDDGIDDYC